MYWYRADTSRARRELGRIPTQHHPWLSLVYLDIFERNYQSALRRLQQAHTITSRDTVLVPYWQGLIYHYMEDAGRSRKLLLSARNYLASAVQAAEVDNWFPCALAVVDAALGNKEAALRETDAALKHMPLTKDAVRGIYPLIARAEVCTLLGDQDAAIEQLELLLSLRAPKFVTVPLLRLDPIYDPLRGNPKFQELLRKYE